MEVKVRVYDRRITEASNFYRIIEDNKTHKYARCWLNGYELEPMVKDVEYVSRMIWMGEDIIVKLDDSLNQVSNELEMWDKIIAPGDKQYFAEILASGVSRDKFEVPWLAMKKYDFYDDPQGPTKFDDLIADLIDCYSLDDVGYEVGENWNVDAVEDCPIIYDFSL